jgi:hypothetical protein
MHKKKEQEHNMYVSTWQRLKIKYPEITHFQSNIKAYKIPKSDKYNQITRKLENNRMKAYHISRSNIIEKFHSSNRIPLSQYQIAKTKIPKGHHFRFKIQPNYPNQSLPSSNNQFRFKTG